MTRRAERTAWAAVADHGATISPWPAKYLNRLSDLLFILARDGQRRAPGTSCGARAATAKPRFAS